MSDLPLDIPRGHAFRKLGLAELKERPDLLDTLLLYEAPRKHGDYRYLVSADIGDGIGQDLTSIDVIRFPTIDEPAEQVAHFVSDTRTPTQAAYVVDALGHLYCDTDKYEALAAIETNNHGLSTQDTLQLHLGYTHFYRWEVADSFNPAKRFTARVGWATTTRTRPILLDKFYEAITTLDPLTGYPDLRINSPFTQNQLADFQTDGALWEAEAARGAHDDCILSAAIGYYVAWRLAGGEREPLNERRRRRAETEERQRERDARVAEYRNSAYTVGEMGDSLDDADEDPSLPPYQFYR